MFKGFLSAQKRLSAIIGKFTFDWKGQSWLSDKFHQQAIVLGPVIIYSAKDPHPCLVVHEKYHQKDQLRYGYVLYLALYLLDGLRVVLTTRRARDLFLEKEAYRIEDECRAKQRS